VVLFDAPRLNDKSFTKKSLSGTEIMVRLFQEEQESKIYPKMQ
jgi:hypothetical protein